MATREVTCIGANRAIGSSTPTSSHLLKWMLIAVVACCTGCSCKDIGSYSGAGFTEFQAGSTSVYSSCSGTPPPDAARAACDDAVNQADAQARSHCKGICFRLIDKAEDQACITTNTHMYPKAPDVCGVSSKTTRSYKCCDMPEGYEPVPPPSSAPKPGQ